MANPTFTCNQCGASLEYSGSGQTMICPYCQSIIQIPEEVWQPVETAKTTRQWTKYIILFLILTVGLPLCLTIVGSVFGLFGSILGILVAIGAAIFPFIHH